MTPLKGRRKVEAPSGGTTPSERRTSEANAKSGPQTTLVPRKPRRRWCIAAITAVVVIVLLLVLPLAGTWGLPYHWACEREAELAYGNLWTPLVLLNAPFNGTANATGTLMLNGQPVPGAAGSIEAANGSSEGLFGLVRYLIYSTSTDLELGPGQSDHCSGSLTAVVGGYFVNPKTAASVTPVQLAPPGSTVTQEVETNFTLETYRTVEWGSMNYNTSAQPALNYSVCASTRFYPVYNQLNVTIEYQTSSLSVVLSSEQVFAYYLPPPGNWLIQVSNSGTWAFDYHSVFC